MCFLSLFRRKPRPVPVDTPKEEPMLRINNLNGFGSGGSLSLTQKGYGYIETATTGNMTMSYANVQSGSAPLVTRKNSGGRSGRSFRRASCAV